MSTILHCIIISLTLGRLQFAHSAINVGFVQLHFYLHVIVSFSYLILFFILEFNINSNVHKAY